MLCEGLVRLAFSQFASTSAAIQSLLSSFFYFFFQVDQLQVAFVSSRFENPLSRTSYFLDGFQLKTQNMPFKSIMVD